MNLWIRSQDKLNLKKIDFILVNGLDLFCSDDLLGTYKTKERALEVLDEIQNHLQLLAIYSHNNKYVLNEKKFVYEMPEE